MFSANKPKEEETLSLLERTPPEIKNEISRHLSLVGLGRLSCVSSAWYSSSTDVWMFLLARDFSIPIDTVRRFAKHANGLQLSFPISFASIYRHRHSLSKAKKTQKKRTGGVFHFIYYPNTTCHYLLFA